MIASNKWAGSSLVFSPAFCSLAVAAIWLAVALDQTAGVAAEPDSSAAATATPDALAWPAVTQTARPWTRWWWLGSAVDDANLTRLLEAYHAAGLGGVEITCIYGVRGAEDRYLPYLSDKWRDAVRHTLREAKRLGMGVDLPTGSGWRTGGPSVTDADANMAVAIEKKELKSGSAFTQHFDRSARNRLVAYSDNGKIVDLLTSDVGLVGDGQESKLVQWTVPPANGISTRSPSAGPATTSNGPPPAAKAKTSTRSPAAPSQIISTILARESTGFQRRASELATGSGVFCDKTLLHQSRLTSRKTVPTPSRRRPRASAPSSTTPTNTKATGATTSSPSSKSVAATACKIICRN